MKSGRFIGVMSGTSLDGVDVVLAAIDETMVAQQASLTWPIPVHLKKGILDICQGQPLTLSQLGQLDTQLGRLFAQAVNALLAQQRLQPRDIVAIGCHGQTVWHEPTGEAPHTLQIGDNNHIVAHTGITVVGDFSAAGYCAGRTRRAAGARFPSRAVGTSDGKTYGPEYRRHRQFISAFPGTGGARVRHGAG